MPYVRSLSTARVAQHARSSGQTTRTESTGQAWTIVPLTLPALASGSRTAARGAALGRQLTRPSRAEGLSGAVDSTIVVRRGGETAHRGAARHPNRKDLSNVDSHRQRTHLVAEAPDD